MSLQRREIPVQLVLPVNMAQTASWANVVHKVSRVSKVSPDPSAPLVITVPRVNVVCLDKRDPRVTLVSMVRPVPPDLRVWLVLMVPRVNEESLDTEENQVSWDHQDDPAVLEPQETQVKLVKQAWLVSQVLRDLLETLAALVCLVLPASPARLDPKAPKENLVLKVVLAQLASPVQLVPPANVDCPVYLDPQVQMASVDKLELQENLVHKASVELRVPPDPWVCLAPMAPLVPLVTLVRLALMASLDPQVLVDAQETKAHPVLQDPPVPPAPLVCLDPLARLVPLAPLENVVTVVRLDLRVWRELLAHVESLVPLALRVKRERLVPPDLREPRVTVVSSVCKVCLVPLVLLVTRVYPVLLVPLVLLVSLVKRVLLVAMVVWVSKVSWVPLVLVVPLVRKVAMVLLVHLVHLVPLVLLVSPWVMTPLPWLPCLVRVNPRALTHSRATTQTFQHVSWARKSPTTSAAT